MTGAILIIIIVLIVGLALFVLVLLSSTVKDVPAEVDDEEISITYFDTEAHAPQPPQETPRKKSSHPIRIPQPTLAPMKTLLSSLRTKLSTIQTSIQSAHQKRAESSNQASKQARLARDKEIQQAVKDRESHNSSPKVTEESLDTSFLEKPATTPKTSQTSPKPRIQTPQPVSKPKTFSALSLIDTPESALPQESEQTQPTDISNKAAHPQDTKSSMTTSETIAEPTPVPEPQASDQGESEPESQEESKADTFVKGLLSDQAETEYMEGVKQPEVDTISDSYYYTYMEKRYIDKIMKNPKDISAYKKLGDLYVEMNNLSDAKESYQVVLKLKPQDDLTRKKLREVEQKILARKKIDL